ncbi:hypothetical protein FRX31_005988 [Thalictrum thalictroides]|uniref:Uncharacterized protein n=1 Tax=Thalictrum thalictroides TaxID=46969 RepID=A0A7J6X431_THATH|nr:hypothetical protein FRX31_005988 [Thalictrum thalictroides]
MQRTQISTNQWWKNLYNHRSANQHEQRGRLNMTQGTTIHPNMGDYNVRQSYTLTLQRELA